ncbi:MAG: hypothetical protein ACI9OE_001457 [Mariniflexile sp.]|jgi:hypothetical protein
MATANKNLLRNDATFLKNGNRKPEPCGNPNYF